MRFSQAAFSLYFCVEMSSPERSSMQDSLIRTTIRIFIRNPHLNYYQVQSLFTRKSFPTFAFFNGIIAELKIAFVSIYFLGLPRHCPHVSNCSWRRTYSCSLKSNSKCTFRVTYMVYPILLQYRILRSAYCANFKIIMLYC